MRFGGLLELAVEIDLGEQLIESIVKRCPRRITEIVHGHPERVLWFPLSFPKCRPHPSQSGTINMSATPSKINTLLGSQIVRQDERTILGHYGNV